MNSVFSNPLDRDIFLHLYLQVITSHPIAKGSHEDLWSSGALNNIVCYKTWHDTIIENTRRLLTGPEVVIFSDRHNIRAAILKTPRSWLVLLRLLWSALEWNVTCLHRWGADEGSFLCHDHPSSLDLFSFIPCILLISHYLHRSHILAQFQEINSLNCHKNKH